MNIRSSAKTYLRGFTLIELMVVLGIIGLLATISILGYGAWRTSVSDAQVKSDLNAVASAMENSRTFNNGYSASVPDTVKPSDNVTLTPEAGLAPNAYCVEGANSDNLTRKFYIASESKEKGVLEGRCADRPGATVPSAPTNLTVALSGGTQINLSWTAATNAGDYTAQCASDAGFIVGLKSTTVSAPTVSATISGLTPSSTFYCRVNATNIHGTSAWTATVSTATDNSYGSLAVASSIEGYWTSPPQGFLLEDGSAVSRTTYADLFSVIGTTYGVGDGTNTFNLPDSRGRTAVNLKASDVEFATIGQMTGSKTEMLSIAQMPSHTHVQNAHNHTQNAHTHANPVAVVYGGNASTYRSIFATNSPFWSGADPNNPTTSTTATNIATTATNQNTGGGEAHNNIQPSIVKTAAIKYSTANPTTDSLPAGTSIQGYWSSAPSGYVLEDGSNTVSRSTCSDLYTLIGSTYGAGSNGSTFKVPDSRGRAAANLSSLDTEFDVIGEMPGSKQETLTIAQIPSHTHLQDPHNHTQNAHTHLNPVAVVYGGNAGAYRSIFATNSAFWSGADPNNPTSATTATNNSTTATNQNTGGGGSHNEIQPSIVKQSAIKCLNGTGTGESLASGTSVSGYWTTAPSGYLLENGQTVSKTTYPTLWSAIGYTYGGSGDNFTLPDSRGRIGVNLNEADIEFDTVGKKFGTKTETISIATMPSHTHLQDPHNHTQNAHNHLDPVAVVYGGDASTYRSIFATNSPFWSGGDPNNPTAATAATNNATTATNQNTGGGGSHNNIQPTITKLFVIKI